MQNVSLYLGNDRLDLFGDEQINVTESIRNAKDISKVFTTFSRQFTIPASKNNNKLFQHYYNYHIQNGYDARVRQTSRIEINHLVFRYGKLKLNGVDLKDGKPFAYRVTFYGSVVELKDVLGEDKLFSLTDLDIDKDYSASAVKTALLNNADSDGCLVPLITHSQRLYYDTLNSSQQSGNLYYDGTAQGIKFLQLKYAIKLSKIIDAIENQYSEITFATDSFFKSASYDVADLYMWCHRERGQKDIVGGGEYSYGFSSGPGVSGGYYEVSPATGYSMREVYVKTVMDSTSTNSIYDILITVNDEIHERFDNLKGDVTKSIEIGNSFDDGDLVKVLINTYEESVSFDDMKMEFTYFIETQGGTLDYTEVADALAYNNIPSNYSFNIASNMPDMKIIDFLSSLFKMFNLVAYVTDDNKIQVLPLDSFYTTNELDITPYVDIDKSAVDAALPFKEIFFKYKDTGTILANQHIQELSDVEWGGDEYTDTENIDGETYKVEPNFHHAKYERLVDLSNSGNVTGVQYGYFVDDNEEAYLGSPLIMYVNLQAINRNIGFLSRDTVTQISQYGYMNMPSNVKDMDSDTSNTIHFDIEKNEYTGNNVDQSLFERFYKKYIQNVFSKNTRILKVSAYLPSLVVVNIKLSDKIIWKGSAYRINSMNINLNTGKTEFELINYYSI